MKRVFLFVAMLLVAGAIGVGWWVLRPGPGIEAPAFVSSLAVLPAESRHDAFTDLVRFRGTLVLAHVAAPSHLGSTGSTVVVRLSEQGTT